MTELIADVVVIGAGPAGLAAAIKAKQEGAARVMVLERDRELGGILQQCIHNGFGLHLFGTELTGPEYAFRFIDEALEEGVEFMLDTMVLEIGADRTIIALNENRGMFRIGAGAVVLAMGCRERNRGAVTIPGTRPAGVFTAGAAQRLVNMEGYMPGKKVVILGSGDIGLIMARRMTWEGAKVEAVLEILPFPSGLTRNLVQCLNDQGIPLHLGNTVVKVHGLRRVEGVTAAKVDEKLRPIPGTEWFIPCDTLLLSIGLIPENELSRMAGVRIDPVTGGPVVTDDMETSVKGIFACGNVVHVHDLVDNVTMESRIAGEGAAKAATGRIARGGSVNTLAGENIRYVVPHRLGLKNSSERDTTLYMRVVKPVEKVRVEVVSEGKLLHSKSERVLKPAEMLVLKLPKGKLEGLGDGKEVEFRINAD